MNHCFALKSSMLNLSIVLFPLPGALKAAVVTVYSAKILYFRTRKRCTSVVSCSSVLVDIVSIHLFILLCRQDGKDSLKFYTEPGFFFELWCQSLQKDAARNQQRRNKRQRRAPVSFCILQYSSHYIVLRSACRDCTVAGIEAICVVITITTL